MKRLLKLFHDMKQNRSIEAAANEARRAGARRSSAFSSETHEAAERPILTMVNERGDVLVTQAPKSRPGNETRRVEPFSRVKVTGPVHVEIVCGDVTALRLAGDESLIERITTKVVDDCLTIQAEGVYLQREYPCISFQTKELDELSVGGPGDVTVADLNADDFTLTAPGSGDVTISGRARRAEIELSGSGSLDGSELVVGSARVDVLGSGDLSLAFEQLAASEYDTSITSNGRGSVTLSGVCEAIHINNHSSGTIDASGLMVGRAEVSVSSNGDLLLNMGGNYRATAGLLDYVGTGAGDATITGEVSCAKVALRGTGGFDGSELTAASADLQVEGSGDLSLSLSTSLSGCEEYSTSLNCGGRGGATLTGRTGHLNVVSSGSGDIDASDLTASSAEVSVHSCGDFSLTMGSDYSSPGEFLKYTSNGSGDATVTGKARSVSVAIANRGSFDGSDLVAGQGELTVRGSGSISLDFDGSSSRDSDEATVECLGVGDITLTGRIGKITMTSNGSGTIDASSLRAAQAEIDSTSNGDIHLELSGRGGGAGEIVIFSSSGSGDTNLTGSVRRAELTTRSNGNLDASSLDADEAVINCEGTGDISLSVNKQIEAHATSSGDVTIYGSPMRRNISSISHGTVNFE